MYFQRELRPGHAEGGTELFRLGLQGGALSQGAVGRGARERQVEGQLQGPPGEAGVRGEDHRQSHRGPVVPDPRPPEEDGAGEGEEAGGPAEVHPSDLLPHRQGLPGKCSTVISLISICASVLQFAATV